MPEVYPEPSEGTTTPVTVDQNVTPSIPDVNTQPDDIDLQLAEQTAELNVADIGSTAPDPSQPWLDALSTSTAQTIITSSDLPQPSKDRLLSQSYTSPDQVTSAIESERLYLAQLSQDSIIQIGDSPPRSPSARNGAIAGLRSSVDQLSLGLDSTTNGEGVSWLALNV